MGEIVAAALTSHAPLIIGKPEVSRPDYRDRLPLGFQELRRRISAAPRVLVVFANDPGQNCAYNNSPVFCVGLADDNVVLRSCSARFPKIPTRKIRSSAGWSMTLPDRQLADKVDVAYSYEIESWDEISVHLHFLPPDADSPVAPLCLLVTKRADRCEL